MSESITCNSAVKCLFALAGKTLSRVIVAAMPMHFFPLQLHVTCPFREPFRHHSVKTQGTKEYCVLIFMAGVCFCDAQFSLSAAEVHRGPLL